MGPHLVDLGWDERWEERLAEVPGDPVPGRVARHDGAGLTVATAAGTKQVPLATRLQPEPVVGDWVALVGDVPVAVLPRTTLLRRRAATEEAEQALAANVEVVLLVAGLDRPVRQGRIQRGAALASDAGAEAVVVLTKAALPGVRPADVAAARRTARRAVPGIPVVTTSVEEGVGVEELREVVRGRTAALVGESGAGKSSIVNALVGAPVAATGDVRAGDAKGRHTTTAREVHVLPGGGVLIDTPGIRAVGLWVDPEAVDRAFEDIEALAAGCRFSDCRHDAEPGCAVRAAVHDGQLAEDRLEAWRSLRAEAEAAAARAEVARRRARRGRRR